MHILFAFNLTSPNSAPLPIDASDTDIINFDVHCTVAEGGCRWYGGDYGCLLLLSNQFILL